jgi:DNA gyrase subunit B
MRISKIENYTQEIPVYDLTIEGSHNFIVDGGICVHNSVKPARNPRFQEVLPFRGKIINAMKTEMKDLLTNQEVIDIFLAVGAMENSGTELRTHNVLIMADPDPDAWHINSLAVTLFVVLFPSFIKNHNLYIVNPPLYTLESTTGDVKMYGSDKAKLIAAFKAKHPKKSHKIHRNKGLGSMNPKDMQLHIDPKTRDLTRVTWDDNTLVEMTKVMGSLTEVRRAMLEEGIDE